MSYVVIKSFADLNDNKHFYRTGDVFPRLGVKATKERIQELSGNANLMHTPFKRGRR